MSELLYLLGGIAILGFVIFRQFSLQPVSPRRMVAIPALAGFFGLRSLAGLALDPISVFVLCAGALLGAGLGWWRGATFQVFRQNGQVLSRGTWMTAVSWAVLIGLRIALVVAGRYLGVTQTVATGDLLIGLALTFAAQNTVIWVRSQRGLAEAAA